MPRRNRNAHALIPDTDQLADQARQLTTELCRPVGILRLNDEVQAFAAKTPTAGEYLPLRTVLTRWASYRPGSTVGAADVKAVATDAR